MSVFVTDISVGEINSFIFKNKNNILSLPKTEILPLFIGRKIYGTSGLFLLRVCASSTHRETSDIRILHATKN